jgi:hypothetical protein
MPPLSAPDADSLDLNLATICYIIVKARAFDAQADVVEPDYGSDAIDDQARQVLEAYADDPTHQELFDAIDNLGQEEQCRLVALAWIGRGTYDRSDWAEALAAATDGHTAHTAIYLTSMPLLGDYLEEGLAAFGLSCLDLEKDHL